MKKYLSILLMAAMAASFPITASADSRIDRLERQVAELSERVRQLAEARLALAQGALHVGGTVVAIRHSIARVSARLTVRTPFPIRVRLVKRRLTTSPKRPSQAVLAGRGDPRVKFSGRKQGLQGQTAR